MADAALETSRRRVRRFGVAMLSMVVAASGVKLIDYLVARGEHSHQEECLENLRAICFAERMVQATSKPFITRVADLPAPVPAGNRFAYFLGPGPLDDRWPDAGRSSTEAAGVGVDPSGWEIPPGMKARVNLSDLPARFLGDAGLGPSPDCPGPSCAFVAACAGNLDVDDELDVWSTSTQPRSTPSGSKVAPCEPYHEHADLEP